MSSGRSAPERERPSVHARGALRYGPQPSPSAIPTNSVLPPLLAALLILMLALPGFAADLTTPLLEVKDSEFAELGIAPGSTYLWIGSLVEGFLDDFTMRFEKDLTSGLIVSDWMIRWDFLATYETTFAGFFAESFTAELTVPVSDRAGIAARDDIDFARREELLGRPTVVDSAAGVAAVGRGASSKS